MVRRTNVGIVGCGRIADLHAEGYKNNPDARIYAVCDVDRGAAERRAREWGAQKVFASFEELLADPTVEAVEILTPQLTHEAMVIAALRSKKHVAVQKPMTCSLASADRMIAAAREAGVVFKVTENYVNYPAIQAAKRMIDQGVIGEPLTLRMKYIGSNRGGWDVPGSALGWRIREMAEGRGFVTFDHGHHMWATAWLLMGPAEKVFAWVDSFDGVVDTPSIVSFKHKAAKRYSVCDMVQAPEMTIPSKYYSNDEWFEVTGTKGMLFVRRCTGNIQSGPVLAHFDGTKFHEYDLPSDWVDGFTAATRNFIAAIQGKEAPLLSGEQAREILRMSLALAQSAQRQREVYLAELDHWWPGFYAWKERRIERLKGTHTALPRKKFQLFGEGYSKYAGQALALTRDMLTKFNPKAVEGWNTKIGLRLAPDGSFEGGKLTFRIENGRAFIDEGEIPSDAIFIAEVKAGVWAAILLGKKRPETAFLQGKFKLEGKAEEALRLRDAFGI